ncbi:MAG TPA: ubiquitin-conjugating enzyme E2 [Tepidisphaeraceae bacterium]|nr:ubiquitin-conjugating enzyme E2 [Tepidisphaeraceae bacterium]
MNDLEPKTPMTTKAPTISFACDQCGRPFSVPANFAGRRATCKTCGNKVVVPAKASPAAPRVASPTINVAKENRSARPAAAHQNGAPAFQAAEADAPTADPTTPPSHPIHVAVISEAQCAPQAAAVIPEAALVAREERHALLDAPSQRPAEPLAAPKTRAKVPMRIRRLMVDAEQVAKIFAGDGPIQIHSMVGDPPELYQVEYRVTGLQRGWLGKPKKRDTHLVEIQLTSEYPRIAPKCRMLTPVFHPNIDETTICVGDHWTAGERLVDLIIRIGQMLAYQDYNIKSPLNGEAAMWADLNPMKLPVDSQNLHLADAV